MIQLASVFLSVLVTGPAECALLADDQIVLADAAVRVADIADLDCLDEIGAARLGALVIARLPDTANSVAVSRRELGERLIRHVPGLRGLSGLDGEIRLSVQTAAAPAAASQGGASCLELETGLQAGSAVQAFATRSVGCDPARDRADLYFDRLYGVVRAGSDLPAGAFLGQIALPAEAFADTGETVTIQFEIGPVRIERSVEALEASPGADRIFVRDADGHVFAVDTTDLAPASSVQEEMH